MSNMKKLNEGVKVLNRIGFYFLSMLILTMLMLPLFILFNIKIIFLWVLFLILILLFTEWMIRLSYNNFKYSLEKDELRIEKGIIWKVYKSVPFSKVQNVEIRRGIIARILGFSAIMIHTAGYSAAPQGYMMPEGYLPAVSIKEAEDIRNFILKKIKGNSK